MSRVPPSYHHQASAQLDHRFLMAREIQTNLISTKSRKGVKKQSFFYEVIKTALMTLEGFPDFLLSKLQNMREPAPVLVYTTTIYLVEPLILPNDSNKNWRHPVVLHYFKFERLHPTD